MTPIVLFAVVLIVSLLTRRVRHDPDRSVRRRGAGRPRRCEPQTLAGLSDRLRFVPSTDAAVDAVRSADIGIQIPDDLDDRLARHEVVDVTVYDSATTADSRSAIAFLRAGFGTIHEQAVVAAAGDGSAVNHFTLDVVDLEQSQPATRVQGAGLVAAVVLLQATMIVGATATRLLSRGNRGLLDDPAPVALPPLAPGARQGGRRAPARASSSPCPCWRSPSCWS